MITSLHADFNVVFGNVYFVLKIFNVFGRRMRFSESSQNSKSKKPIFGQFEVIFSSYKIFPGWRGFFLLAHLKGSFYRKDGLSTWSQKKLFNFPQKY